MWTNYLTGADWQKMFLVAPVGGYIAAPVVVGENVPETGLGQVLVVSDGGEVWGKVKRWEDCGQLDWTGHFSPSNTKSSTTPGKKGTVDRKMRKLKHDTWKNKLIKPVENIALESGSCVSFLRFSFLKCWVGREGREAENFFYSIIISENKKRLIVFCITVISNFTDSFIPRSVWQ